MAALTTQKIVDAGTKPTFAAASASDTVDVGNGHSVFVVYKNTDANAKTVTITAFGTTDYAAAYPNAVVSVGATTGEVWIPIRKSYDPGDGTNRATLAVTGTGGVTGVTVAVVTLP